MLAPTTNMKRIYFCSNSVNLYKSFRGIGQSASVPSHRCRTQLYFLPQAELCFIGSGLYFFPSSLCPRTGSSILRPIRSSAAAREAAKEMTDVHLQSAPLSEPVSVSRASEIIDEAVQSEEDRPVRCAKFRQQELWAWKPVWSPQVIVIMYLIVAAIFIPMGVVVLIQSTRLLSTARLRYDQIGDCDLGNIDPDPAVFGTCTVPVRIDKNVTAPAYVYYGLVNFYQNARTYTKSRSDTQNRGEENADTTECEPLEFQEGTDIPRNPCGLVAFSEFNDTFQLCTSETCAEEVNLDRTNIAWDVDREKRFLESNDRTEFEDERVTSEPFMVWMRLAAYRNWKKLYGRIETDLPAGTYYMNITSRFPVGSFDGEKFFFISETTWFGGPNEALGIAYIVVGGATLTLAIAIAVRARISTKLDLPPETTVALDGIVADADLPKAREAVEEESP